MRDNGLLPILLSVSNRNFVAHDEGYAATDSEFRKRKSECLERDGQQCRFCNFKNNASGENRFTEVHHIDGDHKNNDLKNLATICPLCHMSFHVDRIGDEGIPDGVLIFAPEFTQAQINHITRTYIYTENMRNKLKDKLGDGKTEDVKQEETRVLIDACASLYDGLKGRMSQCAELTPGLEKPGALGGALNQLKGGDKKQKAIYDDRANRLFGIRVLPILCPILARFGEKLGPPDGTYVIGNIRMWTHIYKLKLTEIESAEGRKSND